MISPEAEEPDSEASRPELPSFYHSFLYDELQTLFERHTFFAIDRTDAVLGGVLQDFWDEGVHAEVSVVNTLNCDGKPETYILYVHNDESFVGIHVQQGRARWCIPSGPLLNDEEVQDAMNDLEHTEFTRAVTEAAVPHAYDRVCTAWSHTFLQK